MNCSPLEGPSLLSAVEAVVRSLSPHYKGRGWIPISPGCASSTQQSCWGTLIICRSLRLPLPLRLSLSLSPHSSTPSSLPSLFLWHRNYELLEVRGHRVIQQALPRTYWVPGSMGAEHTGALLSCFSPSAQPQIIPISTQVSGKYLLSDSY